MQTDIKLLYVIHTMNNGGAEALAIRLAEQLNKSHFPTAVCSLSDEGPLKEILVEKQIPFFTLGKKAGKDLGLIWRLKDFVSKRKYTIVHTHNQGPLLYAGLAKVFGGKFLLVHTEHINETKEISYSTKDILYNKFLYRQLDGFISIARHLTKYFRSHYNLSHAQLTTIPNSIAIETAPSLPISELRRELGLSDETVIVGNISALRPQKDHRTLIKAMEIIVSKMPNIVLVIAGEGESRHELFEYVRQFELGQHIRFLGYRPDVKELLAQFDLFVLSSLYEGLPLCILEAMAAGLAVVATNVEGTNELVRNGQTGLLVPSKQPEQFADAIITVLRDQNLRERMGVAGQQLVADEYNFEKMIDSYASYYRAIMGKKPKA